MGWDAALKVSGRNLPDTFAAKVIYLPHIYCQILIELLNEKKLPDDFPF